MTSGFFKNLCFFPAFPAPFLTINHLDQVIPGSDMVGIELNKRREIALRSEKMRALVGFHYVRSVRHHFFLTEHTFVLTVFVKHQNSAEPNMDQECNVASI